ncbi:hypothetical protein [Halobacterium wangiae]|uniref:hypothetical protein n=1 Tax=Halobacterium wangiae TaxID=2902623 RepID=UPI001E47C4BA|nr:hypothetical protein [Halobacterium wangiae]
MEFETFSVMALGTAFLSTAAATSAYLASPQNWWVSLLLGLTAALLLAFVALKARNRTVFA